MDAKVAVLTVHGMGETAPDYSEELYDELAEEVGQQHWKHVHFRSIYYQGILQQNQAAVFNRMRAHIDWMKLRKFLLYGFSDAASLEYKREAPDSTYLKVQQEIQKELDAVFAVVGPLPLVVVAHSLGCQVLSSYVWDAQADSPEAGVFSLPPAGGVVPGSPQDEFRRMASLERMFTTGCNIPIFVAGHARIEPFARPQASFRWHNYFDEDDVLGWPLGPLSPSYAALVEDHEINAGGWTSAVTKSWNPLSHGEYWTDRRVVRDIAADLVRIVTA